MSAFDDLIEEYMGDVNDINDIRVVVRRLWDYDFVGFRTRMWDGQGPLITDGGVRWLGTVTENGSNIHQTPRLQDGRDGSSAAYQFSMTIPDLPDESARNLYEALKEDQDRVAGRTLTCYLVLFKQGEALRPSTPIRYFKQLTMSTPRFSESVQQDGEGRLIRTYKVSLTARDNNAGRANTPNRTYNDTIQREYARQLGVTQVDKGLEYVAALANRTYQVP